MASKKNVNTVSYGNPPQTLKDHPFYGFELDDDQKAFRDAIFLLTVLGL